METIPLINLWNSNFISETEISIFNCSEAPKPSHLEKVTNI